jgi:hypothetical protein
VEGDLDQPSGGSVTREMTIFREEVFVPVVTVTPFDTEDEAIASVTPASGASSARRRWPTGRRRLSSLAT